ncbi:MAG: glutathione peroxidase [Acidimicrobiales bacterium]|nr:glutathione peroxidase [Acidimicrobiales bacterium]
MASFHDFNAVRLNGDDESLAEYKGKVALVVNTASQCGFTGQYDGLQKLHDELGDRGFTVLGFPCNQFGKQEPGDEEQIGAFCQKNYGVTFPMFSKVDVNGGDAHPLYKFLRKAKKGLLGEKIKWNFTKFLVDADGKVIKRYGSTTKPEAIKADIEKLLK